MLVGAATLVSGVALSIQADAGVGSWQVLELGIVSVTGWSLGTVIVVESVIVLVIAWVWLDQPPGIATVLLALGGGPTIEWLLGWLPTPTTWLQGLGMVTASAVVMGLGVGCYVAAMLGASAQDSLFVGLYRKFDLRPGPVRFVVDTSLVVGGWLLGGPVGVGTVVVTFVTPPIIDLVLPHGHRLAGTTPTAPNAHTPGA